MRKELKEGLEACRVTWGEWGSCPGDGLNGAFLIPGPNGPSLRIIASDGVHPDAQGWEHVSVSLSGPKRCPNWPEMCFVKALFWDDHEAVIQIHPAKADYINHHPYTLHLWKHRINPIVTPPSWLVGPK